MLDSKHITDYDIFFLLRGTFLHKKKLNFTGHLHYWNNLAQTALNDLEDRETTVDLIDNKTYKINIDEIKGKLKPTLSQINIFTDGSKTPLGTGAGYVIMKANKQLIHTQSLNLPNDASIYQAELSAIAHACQWMHNNMEDNIKYIKIFSDSKSSLEALQARTCKSNTVL